MCYGTASDAIPERSANEKLRYINVTVFVIADANSYLAPLRTQDVGAMAAAAHEGGLRLEYVSVMGDVFAGALIAVAKVGKHIANAAISGRYVRKVVIGIHVGGFDARNAAELFIQRQRVKSVRNSIFIQQIPCIMLLRYDRIRSIITRAA